MAGLRGAFFDTSVLIAGSIDFGRNSQHVLLLMDAVADGRIERPLTAWRCAGVRDAYFWTGTRLGAREHLFRVVA